MRAFFAATPTPLPRYGHERARSAGNAEGEDRRPSGAPLERDRSIARLCPLFLPFPFTAHRHAPPPCTTNILNHCVAPRGAGKSSRDCNGATGHEQRQVVDRCPTIKSRRFRLACGLSIPPVGVRAVRGRSTAAGKGRTAGELRAMSVHFGVVPARPVLVTTRLATPEMVSPWNLKLWV